MQNNRRTAKKRQRAAREQLENSHSAAKEQQQNSQKSATEQPWNSLRNSLITAKYQGKKATETPCTATEQLAKEQPLNSHRTFSSSVRYRVTFTRFT
jgi:hypothetical protein